VSFLAAIPNWVFCLVIFFAKILEVMLGSIKTIMLVKGQRALSCLFALIEVFIWAFVVSGIIDGLTDNIWWLLSYCFGFAGGFYVGAVLDQVLALGTLDATVITPARHKEAVAEYLKANGIGYYITPCEGATGQQVCVDVVLPRKEARRLRKEITEVCNGELFVTNSEISYIHGGYMRNTKSRGC